MPKVVDHEQRRQELATAVWRVIDRSGISGATVRAVAAEAGWSMGILRYYFDSQDELLRFAVQILRERIPLRLRRHHEAASTGRELAQRLLEEFLPLDTERRVEAAVWLAALERARTDPAFDQLRDSAWHGQRRICRLAVTEVAGGAHAVDGTAELEPPSLERAAAVLHTYVDGLTLHAAAFPEYNRPGEVRQALAAHLAELATQAG